MLTSLVLAPRVVARAHTAFVSSRSISATSTEMHSALPLPSLSKLSSISKAFHTQTDPRQNALPVESTAPVSQSKPAPESQDSPSSQKKESAASLGFIFIGAAALTFISLGAAYTLSSAVESHELLVALQVRYSYLMGRCEALEERASTLDERLFKLGQGVNHDKQISEPTAQIEVKETTTGASHA
ncbi:hypothetical protein NBRC10512v2_003632 [Rhodotorula toruloides]